MAFVDIFTPEGVLLDVGTGSKREVVERMLEHAARAGVLPRRRREEAVAAILDREERGSTGMGGGVAIPHARLPGLRRPAAVVGRSPGGLDFRAIDGEPVHVVVMLISPESRADEHLQALRWISTVARDPDFASFIRQARSAEDVLDVFTERA